MRRRLLIFVAIALAAPIVLGAAGWLLLESPLAERFVRDRVLAALAEATGAEVSIEDVDLAPLRGEATVLGLSLRGGGGAVRELDAARVAARVSLFEAMRGRVRVTAVDAEGVTAALATGVETEDEPRPLDLTSLTLLTRVRVSRGSLVVQNERIPFELDVRGLRVLGAPAGPGRPGGRGQLEAGPVTLQLEGLPTQEAERVTARFHWTLPRVEVTEFDVRGPSGTLEGSLEIGIGTRGVVLEGSAGGVLRAERVIPAPVPEIRGPVRVWSSFGATVPGAWEVQADLEDEEGLVALGTTWTSVRTHLELGPSRAVVEGLRARSRDGSVADGVTFQLEGGDWSVEGKGRLRVSEALERAGLDPTLARGTARLELAASGTTAGGVERWVADGEVEAAAARDAALAGGFSGRGGPEGSVFTYRGSWGGGALRATLEWPGPLPDGPWRAQASLAAPTGDAARPLLARLLAEAAERGLAAPDALVPDPAGGLELSATLSGERAAIVEASASAVALDPVTAGAGHERLEGSVRWSRSGSWRASARLADRAGLGVRAAASGAGDGLVRFSVHVDELPLDAVRRVAGGLPEVLDEVDGRVSGELFGTWRDGRPRARFVVRGAGTALGGGETVLHASGAWEGERVEISRARLSGPAGRALYSGRVELPFGPLGAAARGRLEAEVDLAGVPPWLLPGGAGGRIAWRGEVAAPAGALPAAATGSLRWRGVRVRGLSIPDGTGEIRHAGSGIEAAARADELVLEARVEPGDGSPRLEASLAWSDLEAFEMLRTVTGRELDLAVAIGTDGWLELSGPLLEPEAWTGEGRVERLLLEGPSVVIRQPEAAVFSLEAGGRVRLADGMRLVSDAVQGGALTLDGEIDLLGEDAGAVAIAGRGASDLRIVEVFDPDLVAAGDVRTTFALSGTLASPLFEGRVTLEDGRIRHLTLNEAVDGLQATLVLDGTSVRVEDARARLGGGTLEGEGRIELAGWLPERLELQVRARDVAMSLPRGVFGRYDAGLTIAGPATAPEIRGQITVLSGRYSRPFGFGRLLGARARLLDPGGGFSSWMSRIALRLDVVAEESFLVDNDLARLETAPRLTVSGTLAQPLMSGSIALLDGGRIDFRGVEYEVLSGQVLLDDLDADPVRVRLRAVTDVRGYRVRLDLDASTERVDYQLSSTPALPEADILSLLVTGETLAERGGGSGLIGADMAGAYFGSELGELLLSGTAQRLLGLTQFQLAPSRAGPDARPTARLTLGRRIDDRTLALYSTDLSSEGEDVYRLERELTRRLKLSLSRESLGGVGVDLRWLRRFGEAADAGDGAGDGARELAGVEVLGLPGDVEAPSARRLGLRRGKRLRRADRLEARDLLRERLVRAGYLEARVEGETREAREGRVSLVFRVDPGARWTMDMVGPDRAVRDARSELAELWSTTEFRAGLLREAERVLKDAFADDGFAAASIEISRPDPGERRLVVRVDPGPKVSVEAVRLEGVGRIPGADVRAQILSRPASGLLLTQRTAYSPRLVREDVAAVRALYESRGYLRATVAVRERFTRDGSKVVLAFEVEEGEQATVGAIRVEGAWPEELGAATSLVPLEPGEVFLPEDLEGARRALRSALDEAGYYEASVVARTSLEDGTVNVTLRASPGPRGVVEEVVLEGLERTQPRLVRRALRLEAGEPLTQRGIRDSERELFRLGLFRGVEVSHEPVEGDDVRRVVTVRLDEIPPVSFLGTVGYDTEEKLRASAAISHDNLTGRGRSGSLQTFVSERQVGARATLEDPHLFRQRTIGLATIGWLEEEREGFTLESTELELEVGSRRDRASRWRVGYQLREDRFEEVTLDPDALRDVLLSERGRLDPIRLGSLRGSWLIDRRDDPFLPGSGWIVRADTGVWARPLASEAEFSRLTGQIAAYAPWNERLTFAGSLRAGWSFPRGDTPTVPLSERFFAGGADSIRGFERDRLGPLDGPDGEPLGGESLVLVNLEARYRLTQSFEIAAFIDAGNVWLAADDVSLSRLRETWGVAVRYRTPVGALRLGYGRKVSPLPGESSGEIYLAIGEPF